MRDVARIHSLDALPRLLARAASHTARLLNVSNLVDDRWTVDGWAPLEGCDINRGHRVTF